MDLLNYALSTLVDEIRESLSHWFCSGSDYLLSIFVADE